MAKTPPPTLTETICLISKQTGLNDLIYIERVYYECDRDEIKTIVKLMDRPYALTNEEKRPRTMFDDIRQICDEKDTIFQEMLSKQKNKST